MSIAEAIKTARPSLSKSSVTTYSSVLGSLYKKVFNTGEVNLKNFDDTEKVIYFLRDKKPAARKSVLAALVVLTGNAKYREAMSKDITSYNEEIAKQVATPAQKAAEISPDEIHAIYAHLASEASHLFTKKQQTVSDLLAIQDSVILALLGGEFIAPRRSLDFCAMKIKNLDTKTDNYIDKVNLVFNQYKCAKTYSTQEVAMPKELQAILKKWIKINPSEWLLFTFSTANQCEVESKIKLHLRWAAYFY